MDTVEGDKDNPPGKETSDGTGPTSPRSPRRDAAEAINLVPQCTELSCCVNEKEEYKFQCNTCKRYVHYRCAGLPVYQIYQFTTKNYRNFICITCTQVPSHLKNILPRPPPPVETKEISELKLTINRTQLEVDTLAETNRMLQAKIKEQSVVITKLDRKYAAEMKDHSTVLTKAKVLKDNLKTYEEQIIDYKRLIVEKETDSITYKNQIAELKEKHVSPGSKNGDGDSLEKLTELMSSKFEEIEKNLKESILKEVDTCNRKFEEKLNEVVTMNKTYAESLSNLEGSTVVEQQQLPPPDLRSIIREEQNEQLADETDKKRRACNFVIHGVEENTNSNKDEAKQRDQEIVTTLMEDLQLECDYKTIFRLGNVRPDGQSKRPIKVTMNNEKDKKTVMDNLRKLKGKEKYKGVSMTDDNTIKDRALIKEWTEKAKAANEKEAADSLFEWKVRGNPKNGLSLKKFRKRDSIVQA